MANSEKFVTLHNAKIESMWGLCASSYVYEGCSILLSDGRPCALGRQKRRLRRQDANSPMGPHSRGRISHQCSPDGAGVHMYCFAVQIGGEVIQVNEESGQKLMGMSGKEFKDELHSHPEKINSVCTRVMSSFWTVTFVTDQDGCRAISVLDCSESSKIVIKSERNTSVDVIQELKDDKDPQILYSGRNSDTPRVRAQVGPIRRLQDAFVNFGGEILESLKAMSLNSKE